MPETPKTSTKVNLDKNTPEPSVQVSNIHRVNLATGDIEIGIPIGDNMWLPL